MKALQLVPQAPLVNTANTDPHRTSDIDRARSPFKAANQYLSTFRDQTGILMHVHSVLTDQLSFVQSSASQRWIE
jgi:hypothetical protein